MRIERVSIRSKDLTKVRSHYGDLLGLAVVEKDRSVEVHIGKTLLIFEEAPESYPLHFAIMIPTGKLLDARNWLLAKTKLLSNDTGDIFNFSEAWNSSSIYWYDAEGNILELIEHRNIPNQTSGDFSAKDFLYICELGINVQDVLGTLETLKSIVGIDTFIFGNDRFHPVGTEEGLLILSQTGRNWFLTDVAGMAQPLSVTISGAKQGEIVLEGPALIKSI